MARGAGSSFPFRGTDSSLFHEKIVQLQLTDRRVYCESRSAISKAMENLEEKVEIVARRGHLPNLGSWTKQSLMQTKPLRLIRIQEEATTTLATSTI